MPPLRKERGVNPNKLAGDETDAHNAKMTVFGPSANHSSRLRSNSHLVSNTASQSTSPTVFRPLEADALRSPTRICADVQQRGRRSHRKPAAMWPLSTAAAAPQQEPQQPISVSRDDQSPPAERRPPGFCATPEAPARDHNSYAIRTHIAAKVGIDLHQVPAAFRVRPARRKPNDPLTCTLIVSFLEPTDKPWRLFGSSRLAQYIERSSLPSQCDKCWDFHARHLRPTSILQAVRTARPRRGSLRGLERDHTASFAV
ncbi:reverse transcriptase (RNA-dependent DNA polymerase) [Hirsutella rhossiliensis]